ncbi:DUF1326 domain-containing protein [Polaromonas naphthalenivorans]|uniref:DUF1326 domain-containing protein n=1 Tax=Polaromonas naphthalenivorans (strain CJ2) TaxID=365044 RepID=A1VWU9_POLNA|nr:DUF1326 domain-containing protein [Polaromonas naphthalenivorans]ABM40127.1 protein of unknown function DUF1326 [Polaromonas naphthalenivorans CJ2]
MSSWTITGQYMETCNCAFLCPCLTSNLTAQPTEGDCKAAVALHIDKGEKDGVRLGGLSFIVMLHSPGPMGQGDIAVGLIVDETASPPQVEAIRAIATGSAGGPMAMLAPLVGRIAGVERRPIRFEANGLMYSVSAGELVNQACEGLASVTAPGQAIGIDNIAHPVNSRLSLARATRSRFHAFGIDWEDATGMRNGHFAPFAWAG